jgi:hypothetical protein
LFERILVAPRSAEGSSLLAMHREDVLSSSKQDQLLMHLTVSFAVCSGVCVRNGAKCTATMARKAQIRKFEML